LLEEQTPIYACRDHTRPAFVVRVVHRLHLAVPRSSTTVLLELPVSVIERTNLTSLKPARDAMEVEGVLNNPSQLRITTCLLDSGAYVANPPSNRAFLRRG
jgi:hypothetical protein